MNQIDTGKFISSCRKEKGLTQAQLAEKLNITDRAVSKWETGKCMPDSSIMLELCNILDVTVNELLSGERIEMNNYEEKVSENLIELKRKDENNMNKNTIISIIYMVLCQDLVQVKMRNFSDFNPPEAQPQCVFFYTIVRIHLVTYSYNGYEFVSYCRKLPDIRKSNGMPACNREF